MFLLVKNYSKNPTNAPDIAVTITVAIIGESFNTNIINNDIHEINDIPEDNPSKPSIKFIAFVTPTIHKTVIIVENDSLNPILYKNGISKCSILVPNRTTIIAAIVWPNNSCHGFNVFISSNVPVIAITITPNNNRGLDGRELAKVIAKYNKNVSFCGDMKEACEKVKGAGKELTVAFGSLSYLGEFKKCLKTYL